MKTRSWRALAISALGVVAMAAAACAPPPAPSSQSWTFRAEQVTINDGQDQTCVIICVNNEDEPYTLNIGFRVKVGVPGSASTFVVNNRTDAPSVGIGDTKVLTGNEQGAATFAGIQPLDIIDILNTNNDLEVIGVYTWASEEDLIGNGLAADTVADLFEDALNSTIAQSSLPSDAGLIVDLILDNILGSLGLLVNNIPTLGLGDDVLGGGLYIGIGAKGELANLIDAVLADTDPITFDIPIVSLPPDIDGGGIFTLGGPSNFTQTFSGAGGTHTYDFSVTRD